MSNICGQKCLSYLGDKNGLMIEFLLDILAAPTFTCFVFVYVFVFVSLSAAIENGGLMIEFDGNTGSIGHFYLPG